MFIKYCIYPLYSVLLFIHNGLLCETTITFTISRQLKYMNIIMAPYLNIIVLICCNKVGAKVFSYCLYKGKYYFFDIIFYLFTICIDSTGCGFDPHSRRWNIYLNLYFHFFALVLRLSAALSSPEFSRKWGTQSLNTRFLRPTLLCAGYSM